MVRSASPERFRFETSLIRGAGRCAHNNIPLTLGSRRQVRRLTSELRENASAMGYTRSFPLRLWLDGRRKAIDTLASAHAQIGEVEGRGRPLELGRPLAHAYVIRVVAEFQAFTRDLHDLGAEILVAGSTQDQRYRPRLTVAVTEGRSVDPRQRRPPKFAGRLQKAGLERPESRSRRPQLAMVEARQAQASRRQGLLRRSVAPPECPCPREPEAA